MVAHDPRGEDIEQGFAGRHRVAAAVGGVAWRGGIELLLELLELQLQLRLSRPPLQLLPRFLRLTPKFRPLPLTAMMARMKKTASLRQPSRMKTQNQTKPRR